MDIINKNKERCTKNARERYQDLSEEDKNMNNEQERNLCEEKKNNMQKYGRVWYKSPAKDVNQKLVENRKNYSKMQINKD